MAAKQVQLENGVVYRGRIIAFVPGIGKETFNTKLTKSGFKDVQVWTEESEIPSDWPTEARADVASDLQSMAWVQGTWDKPTGQYPGEGTGWEIHDYWPKDKAKPIEVNPAPSSPLWIYGAVAGGVAVAAILLLAASSNPAPRKR